MAGIEDLIGISDQQSLKALPAKPKPPNLFSMKKTTIILAATVIFCSLGNWKQLLQAQSQPVAIESGNNRDLGKEKEDGINIEERKRQIPAIAATFSRYAEPERARKLAQLCYQKTMGTIFMPMDLAEIALAETGGHRLSSKAVSFKGAVGVWQLMPFRARSHGFSPRDMENDEKCAYAAVRELASKLLMAKGSITRAKKLYCGSGPDADVYEARRRQFRKEIMQELDNMESRQAEADQKAEARPS